MKNRRISKISIMMLIGVLFFGLFTTKVKASIEADLVKGHPANIYYTVSGGGLPYDSQRFTTFTLNGEVVYCLDAHTYVSTNGYIGEYGFVNSPYNAAINSKMQLIGHYGYSYPGHNTVKFRMAAQALIWETATNQKVEYWTEQFGYGSYIDISYERNEIMKLVNNHYNRPSFNGIEVTAYYYQEIVIEDSSGLLSQYDIYSDGGNIVRKEGNKLYITPTVIGESTISVIRPGYDQATTIIFVGVDGNSQKMGLFRVTDPVVASIKLNTLGGKITIEKVDSETGLAVAQGDASLEGAVYGVYDLDGNLLTTITTDENGTVTSDYLKKMGQLKLQEISASEGYLLDDTIYEFEVTVDELFPTVVVKEDVVKRDITIFKVFASAETGILTGEPNITFDIYLKSSNELYTSVTTDDRGYASVTLPYGTYVLKQVTSTTDYEKVDDFEIVVNYETDEIVYRLISNAKIKARLQLFKVDADTRKVIELGGIKFRIRDLETDEFVCQTITYPTATTVCVFETDSNGVFITPHELSGEYQIEEIEDQQVYGYLWNSEPLKFSIGENSELFIDETYGALIKVEFDNTRVKGKIEINKMGEALVIENDSYWYEEILLPEVKYGIYAQEDIIVNGMVVHTKDELVAELVTDENGQGNVDNLELGKYYLLELETSFNHVLDETQYNFELKYKDQYTAEIIMETTFSNHLPKGKLVFTKTDLVTGKPVPNTHIEIYHTTDEEVVLIFSGITDNEGNVIIEDLFVGRFYIKETRSAEGYELSYELVYFEITADNQVIKANMTNKQIVRVPNTSTADNGLVKGLGTTLMIVGIGVVIYAKKKEQE